MKASASKGKNGSPPKREKSNGGECYRESADSYDHIARTAYFKAEARGFSPGRELDDWLDAESEYVGKRAK